MKRISLFILFFSFTSPSYSQDNSQELDILFLKIQELEAEIASLRSKIESQEFLIKKLQLSLNNEDVEDNKIFNLRNSVSFKGVADINSKDEIYNKAITELENQNLEESYRLFEYFVKNFSDENRSPLSFFWLGEISLIQGDYDNANEFYLSLISEYPDHYRVPLAHKKIGDIFLRKNEIDKAKIRYELVIKEFPNSTASSLALQLLKNME